MKLCNPKRFKLMEFFYEVSPESLCVNQAFPARINANGIGGSRQAIKLAGVDGERDFSNALTPAYAGCYCQLKHFFKFLPFLRS